MAESVLDQSVLDVLRQLTPPGEPDVLTEVLRLFLQEVPPRIDKLRNAYAAGNIEEVHRSAHSLKGSAGNIGAHAFHALCSQLDEKGKAGDLTDAGPIVEALRPEFDKIAVEIHRLLGA